MNSNPAPPNPIISEAYEVKEHYRTDECLECNRYDELVSSIKKETERKYMEIIMSSSKNLKYLADRKESCLCNPNVETMKEHWKDIDEKFGRDESRNTDSSE